MSVKSEEAAPRPETRRHIGDKGRQGKLKASQSNLSPLQRERTTLAARKGPVRGSQSRIDISPRGPAPNLPAAQASSPAEAGEEEACIQRRMQPLVSVRKVIESLQSLGIFGEFARIGKKPAEHWNCCNRTVFEFGAEPIQSAPNFPDRLLAAKAETPLRYSPISTKS